MEALASLCFVFCGGIYRYDLIRAAPWSTLEGIRLDHEWFDRQLFPVIFDSRDDSILLIRHRSDGDNQQPITT